MSNTAPKIVTNVSKNAATIIKNNSMVNSVSNGLKDTANKIFGGIDIAFFNMILLGILGLLVIMYLYYIGVYTLLQQKIKVLNEELLKKSLGKTVSRSTSDDLQISKR